MKRFKRVKNLKSESDKQIKVKINLIGNVLILLSIFLAFIFQKDSIAPNQYLIISSMIILIFNFVHIFLYISDIKKYKVAFNWYTIDFVFRFLCISLYLVLIIINRAPTSLRYPGNGFDANTLYINSLIINIVLCIFDVSINIINFYEKKKNNKKWEITFSKLFSIAVILFFIIINLNIFISLFNSTVNNIKHANDNKFYNSTKLNKDTFELGEEYPSKKDLIGNLKYDNINDIQIYFFSNPSWNDVIDNNTIINIPYTTKKTGNEEKKVSSEVGDYQYAIIYKGEIAIHQIKVSDTKGPKIVLNEKIVIPKNQIDELYNNNNLIKELFIKSCKDYSGECKYKIEISFEKDSDDYKTGEQYLKLQLIAKDDFDNETKIEKNIILNIKNREYYFYKKDNSIEVKNYNITSSESNYLGKYECSTSKCYFIQYTFDNNYVIMSENDLYGIYDMKNGKQSLKYEYDYLTYNEGYYLLQKKDNYLIMDKNLNLLINKPYAKIYDIIYDNDRNEYYYVATSQNSTEIDLYTLDGIFITSLSNSDSKKYFYESGYTNGKIFISLAYSFGTKDNACDKYYYDINSESITVDTEDICK